MDFIKISASAALFVASAATLPVDAQGLNWYRGNTHVHGTVEGVKQEVITGWYRNHGYDFIVQTEHEKIVDISTTGNKPGQFIVIPGQEITQWVHDKSHPEGVRHTHVNGIGMRTVVMPIRNQVERPPEFKSGAMTPQMFRQWAAMIGPEMSAGDSYLRNLAEIRKQGAVPQVNHPNLNWSVRPSDLLVIEGPYLMEIANGYPFSNNQGGVSNAGEVSLSTEALWDVLLSAGKVVWGVASDDAHEYTGFDRKNVMTPGKGWVVVRAAALDPEAITQALAAGQFYSSNGVKLKDIRASKRSLNIVMDYLPEAVPHMEPTARFKTTFIGKEGRVLKEAYGDEVVYVFDGDEHYVRAVIVDSDGRKAWTQPVFLDGRIKEP